MIARQIIESLAAARRGEIETPAPLPLPDGQYEALRYGYCIEIGACVYPTADGVRCTREGCGGPRLVRVTGGRLFMVS